MITNTTKFWLKLKDILVKINTAGLREAQTWTPIEDLNWNSCPTSVLRLRMGANLQMHFPTSSGKVLQKSYSNNVIVMTLYQWTQISGVQYKLHTTVLQQMEKWTSTVTNQPNTRTVTQLLPSITLLPNDTVSSISAIWARERERSAFPAHRTERFCLFSILLSTRFGMAILG